MDRWNDGDIELLGTSVLDGSSPDRRPGEPSAPFRDSPRWSRRATVVVSSIVVALVGTLIVLAAPWSTHSVGTAPTASARPTASTTGTAAASRVAGAPPTTVAAPATGASHAPAPSSTGPVVDPGATTTGYVLDASVPAPAGGGTWQPVGGGPLGAAAVFDSSTDLYTTSGATRTTGAWFAVTVAAFTEQHWLDGDRVQVGDRVASRRIALDRVVTYELTDQRNVIVLTEHGLDDAALNALVSGLAVHGGRVGVEPQVVPAGLAPVVLGLAGVDPGKRTVHDAPGFVASYEPSSGRGDLELTTAAADPRWDGVVRFVAEPVDAGAATSIRSGGEFPRPIAGHEVIVTSDGADDGRLMATWSDGPSTIRLTGSVPVDELVALVARVHRATADEWAKVAAATVADSSGPDTMQPITEGTLAGGLSWQASLGLRLHDVEIDPMIDTAPGAGSPQVDTLQPLIVDADRLGPVIVRSDLAMTVVACVLPAAHAPDSLRVTTRAGEFEVAFVPVGDGSQRAAVTVTDAVGPITVLLIQPGGTAVRTWTDG